MALPEQCRVEDNVLIFAELADDATLSDRDKLYEHVCFVACTNGLRPAGDVEVRRFEFPPIPDDSYAVWGGRSITAEAADSYRESGYRLCELRLPIAPMAGGAPMAMPSADHRATHGGTD